MGADILHKDVLRSYIGALVEGGHISPKALTMTDDGGFTNSSVNSDRLRTLLTAFKSVYTKEQVLSVVVHYEYFIKNY